MTCIVAVKDGDKVILGADSAGAAGHFSQARADEKVFKNGNFAMGFTSSYRMGQLLRYKLSPPDHDPRTHVDKYMVNEFIDAVRKCLKDGGYASKKDEEETGGTFIVAYQGELFEIQSDYQVMRPADPYCAVGCGYELALGALHATEGLEKQGEERVLLALEAAAKFSGFVKPPFKVVEL